MIDRALCRDTLPSTGSLLLQILKDVSQFVWQEFFFFFLPWLSFVVLLQTEAQSCRLFFAHIRQSYALPS